MPAIIDGSYDTYNDRSKDITHLHNVNYDYDYPGDLKLKPGMDFHEELKSSIRKMARRSRDAMQPRYSTWEEIDKNLTTYVSPEEKNASEDDKTLTEPIIVPVSYATLETLLTYMSSAFLDSPIFTYEGTGPEDTIGAILLSLIVNKHCSMHKVPLNLHTMFRDSLVYGFGAVEPIWKSRKVKTVSSYEEGFINRIGNWIKTGNKKKTITNTIEGNAIENIDPYMYLPDPNFPVHEPQKGQFQGWVYRTTRQALIREENSDKKRFNAKYLKHISGTSQLYNEDSTGRNEKTGVSNSNENRGDVVDVTSMYVDLIPSEWKLGDSDKPEKWLFELAGDEVILFADRVGLSHEKFPIAIAAPDYDGYSISPVSKIETVQGLQTEIDWLIKSHLANVKKSINNMLVVDPSLINMNDIRSPGPGKIIRTRRSIWGRGVGDAIHQLKTDDITKGHLTDVGYLSNIIDKASGVTDNLQGQVIRSGERVSATEARGIMQSGLSRLGKAARITSLQAMYDIGYFFGHHTQQLMSKKTYASIVGEWEEKLKDEYGIDGDKAEITPYDLLIDFDVTTKDGTVPNSGDADVWVKLYSIMANNPQISARFNMTRVFKHIARKMGAKNLNDFVKKQPARSKKVMNNRDVQDQVRRGNLVPK